MRARENRGADARSCAPSRLVSDRWCGDLRRRALRSCRSISSSSLSVPMGCGAPATGSPSTVVRSGGGEESFLGFSTGSGCGSGWGAATVACSTGGTWLSIAGVSAGLNIPVGAASRELPCPLLPAASDFRSSLIRSLYGLCLIPPRRPVRGLAVFAAGGGDTMRDEDAGWEGLRAATAAPSEKTILPVTRWPAVGRSM